MANNRFRLGSAVFACRHCLRLTRDTNGDNGKAEMCEDCHEGCMYENGANDTGDASEAAGLRKIADDHFYRAVKKGGVIEGYAQQ
jgi:hypothetical protein